MKLSKPSISFFCPAYYDEKNLPILIPKVIKILRSVSSEFEIVIVEDGSPDKTGLVADNLAIKYKPLIRVIHHKKNLGYGGALKRGFQEANKYEYVFFTDGDNQFDVNELSKLLSESTQYKVIIGYRRKRALTLGRSLQSIVFNWLIRILFHVKARDINCSMKLIKRSVIDRLKLSSNSSFIEAELLIRLHQLSIAYKEVPVLHFPRRFGKASGGSHKVIFGTSKDIFSFWWRYNKRNVTRILPGSLLLLSLLFFSAAYLLLPIPIQLIHITIPYLMDNGLILYKDIIHHHTPLLWFLLLQFFSIFGFTFFAYRLYFLIIILLTVLFIYKSGTLFSRMTGIFSTIFFATFYFFFFTDSQLEEITIAFFSLVSLYFLLRYIKLKKNINVLFSGIFIGAAIMVKQVIAVLAPLLFLYLLVKKITGKNRTDKSYAPLSLFAFGVSSVIGVVSLYFIFHSAFDDFLYWNILFNLASYAKEAPHTSIPESLKIAFIFTAFIYPFVLVFKKRYITLFERDSLIVLTLFAFGLLFGLLPSFYLNRLRGEFLIAAIGYGLLFAKFLQVPELRSIRVSIFPKMMLVIVFAFGIVSIQYIFGAIDYFNSISNKQYNIVDYNRDDVKTALWLKENTDSNEKIINLGHHYILLLSQRLPANKYIWAIPWLLKPYEKSAADIIKDPPRIVVDHRGNHIDIGQIESLDNWPFYSYLYKNYKKVAEFGDNIIYEIVN